MGFSENSSPSAPERKCFLKVSYDGQSRLVEWSAANSSFKEMDTKVREMFGLKENMKLVYTYYAQRAAQPSGIIMSSDEELATALYLNEGEILVVQLTREVRKRKSPLCRLARAAKAQQPAVKEFLVNLPARVAALPIVTRIQASAQCCRSRFSCPRANANSNSASASNANAAPAPRCCLRGRKKLLLAVLFFVLAAFFMHAKCDQYKYRHHWNRQYHQAQPHHTIKHEWHFPTVNEHVHKAGQVVILGATYGGMDVTQQVQATFNAYNGVYASNHIYGDPEVNQHKFLQVVYAKANPHGRLETFSQSFAESTEIQYLQNTHEHCGIPEHDTLHYGEEIRILGALYDGKSVTCRMRELSLRGDLYYYNFPVSKLGDGHSFTMVYSKNGKTRIAHAKNGQRIHFA